MFVGEDVADEDDGAMVAASAAAGRARVVAAAAVGEAETEAAVSRPTRCAEAAVVAAVRALSASSRLFSSSLHALRNAAA